MEGVPVDSAKKNPPAIEKETLSRTDLDGSEADQVNLSVKESVAITKLGDQAVESRRLRGPGGNGGKIGR
jgi:hypothetical protein